MTRPARSSSDLHPIGLAIVAITLGLLIALLPIQYSAALLAGAVVVGLAVWKPAVGLGCAIILGPTRAYLAALGYYGPLYDLGQIFFALAFAGWLAQGALQREIIVPRLGVLLPLSAYLFVGLVSLFGAEAWEEGLNEAIKWIEVVVTLIITLSEAKHGRLKWIVGAIVLSGVLQAGLGLWQYGRGAGPESFQLPSGFYRAYGTFEQPNPFGGFLGLIWPIAAGLALQRMKDEVGRMKWTLRWCSAFILHPSSFCLLASVFVLAGLYVSFSRGGWLGAAAAGLVMALFLPHRLRWGIGLVAAALAGGGLMIGSGVLPASLIERLANVGDFLNVVDVRGVNINDANFAIVERLAHWQAALEMIRAHPWLGVGWGNYVARYPDFSLINWPFHLGHAHNIYLHTWAEMGLLGLAAYLALWATVIALTVRTIRQTSGLQRGLALGLLGVWAHLLAHQIVDNLHVNNNDLLLAAQLGVLCALDQGYAFRRSLSRT